MERTVTSRAVEMAKAGRALHEIARELDSTRPTISSLLWRARRRGEDVPRYVPWNHGMSKRMGVDWAAMRTAIRTQGLAETAPCDIARVLGIPLRPVIAELTYARRRRGIAIPLSKRARMI